MEVTRHGPSIGTWRERAIPAYIITSDGARHNFHRTTFAIEDEAGAVDLSKLADNERVIAPGLIYRAVHT